ncbi:MAG TPA: protein kinase [Vicinamibacteria bacterium]|nr:protein kinase [Vicinamibacteria bacterium]
MSLRQVGKYRIVEKLGQGAMGEVFRAQDPDLERPVAIKIIAGKLSGDEKARERFRREAKAAAQLNHPNIITVHDFGEEQGQAYMAMELLEGHDLRDLLERGEVKGLGTKLAIMEQVLDGLAFAHSKGVVHRDLKPGNVHVLPSGQVKIVDFGLARRTEDGAATGVVMGTPYYMAPEQAQGERSTTRSDIFSVGATFYEILAGKRPFAGRTIPSVLFAVVHKEPTPLPEAAPEVPAGIAAVVMRALSKAPDERFADATEMREALRAAWTGREAGEGVGVGLAADREPPRDLGPPLSARADTPAELLPALQEVDQYLDDRVAPLMVADSVAAFSRAPVDGAAAEIMAWAARQQQLQPDLRAVDLFFHALHKLSVIGEFHLVEDEKLLDFLRAVGAALAEACPPGPDRDRFRRALAHLGESEMIRSGPVEMERLRSEDPAEPTPSLPASASPALRRLSVLEQRLRRESDARGEAAENARRRVVSQAITAAATEASSEKELEAHLRRLRAAGVASGAEQVFRNLGQELANWVIPKHVSDTADLGPSSEVQAMKKIVSLPEDPIEVARRYRHLVSAATEQFNEGNLGRAVQMFELAAKLAAEKKVDAGLMEPILRKGHEGLDPARLRHFMDTPDRHGQLQAVMAFFEPGLGPKTLLDQLETETRREKRRLWLDLLVVHGEAARAGARSRLLASLETPSSDFGRRNWIYLLRLVPRPAGEAPDAEIAAVARFAAPGNPVFLAKEALIYLGQTRHPRAAEALVSLLRAWEAQLARDEGDDAEHDEGVAILDRVAAAMARQGDTKAWRALVNHALSRRPELGPTVPRLAELASQDLSASPDVVAALVDEVRDSLPRGVLGRLVGRKDQDLPVIVSALAGTRTPAVRALLDELRKRHSTQDVGKAAARALEAPPPSAGPAPLAGQSGELDPGSLPALLHRFAQGKATGTLHLLPGEGGGPPATIAFSQGQLVGARWANRQGAEAVYQLFERAFPGNYTFETAHPTVGGQLPDLTALVKEGVRRTRELQRSSAVVPDDLPLEATGTAPGTVVDEGDYDLIVALWAKACARMPVRRMEGELTADAFRIHRPLAQWLEEGALRVAAPPAEAAPSAAPSP